MFRSDAAHGERGEVPDDFDAEEAEVVGTVPITTRVHNKVPENERVRCKYCDETFKGYHGLKTHLAMLGEDEQHPADSIEQPIESLGIRIPVETSDKLRENREPDYVRRFQRMGLRMAGHEFPQAVPREHLEDLLDDLRQREAEGGGYYQAARMLQQVIEEHSQDIEELSYQDAPNQIPQ